jgi:hypothetical protein
MTFEIVAVLLAFFAQEAGHQHEAAGGEPGEALFGSYPMSRETSGTSWQPDSAPMEAVHFEAGGFEMMLHGFLDFGYSSEPEPRGESEAFTTSMLMLGGRRPLGNGAFGFRVMGSLEPVMGRSGYPLLLQTGETADGTTPLLDRQHPHDVLMEMAVTYSHPTTRESSFFVYAAPVGEPALGPPAFMHRESSGGNPFAPIGHHWFDATHITYGVITVGWNELNKAKIEASIFNGREPDENRWDVDSMKLDSYSLRFTLNPTENWSVQGSFASLNEPELLHQGIDFLRITTSATYNRRRDRGNWQSTLAWGRNKRERTVVSVDPTVVLTHNHWTGSDTIPGVVIAPVMVQNAFLAESAFRFADAHSLFARLEWVEKDELFTVEDPRHIEVYNVGKLNLGYSFDFVRSRWLGLAAGIAGSLHFLPAGLDTAYGETPASFYGFVRARLR